MRILVLTKRQYMGRDLLDDRYGRFHEIPLALAQSGHEVTGVCLSYRPREEGPHKLAIGDDVVAWHSANLHRLLPGGRPSYWRTIDNVARRGRPDVVWACSDVPHALLGVRVAKRIGAPLVIDLYDNFEAYGLTRMPGMRRALQYAIRRSDGVTCVSQPLAELVRERYAYSGAIEVIENAIPSDLFRPGDRLASRCALGLPTDGILVGTAGALSRSRGIECLFAAFERLAAKREDVHLVLAGRLDRHLSPPVGARVHYLGLLAPEQVPVVLAALDVSVISNRESEFGSYCFPQKFYESVAARVPLVVAATGAMRALLREWPGALYEPDDPDSLVAAIERNIEARQPLPLEAPLWSDLARRLESFLESVVRGGGQEFSPES